MTDVIFKTGCEGENSRPGEPQRPNDYHRKGSITRKSVGVKSTGRKKLGESGGVMMTALCGFND
jgi:hypothetical protein